MSVYGAYRLARFDASGLAFFEHSVAAFWRSFFAAVIVAPVYTMILSARYVADGKAPSFPVFLVYQGCGYVITWLAFPVVVEAVTRSLGCRRHFVRFVIAYNWAVVIQYAVVFPIVALQSLGSFSQGTANGLAFLIFIWTSVYTAYVARTSLGVEIPPAVGIVVLEIVLSLMIYVAVTSRI